MPRSKKRRGFTEDLERTYKSMLMSGKFAYELPEFMLVDHLSSGKRKRAGRKRGEKQHA
jgi:hypothetical protein